MGTKRSVLTDESGLPLAVVISGANTHDIKLLGETPYHIVVSRPEPSHSPPIISAKQQGIMLKITNILISFAANLIINLFMNYTISLIITIKNILTHEQIFVNKKLNINKL